MAGHRTAEALGSAELYCESCAGLTLHRIVRLERTGAASTTLRGVARCRVCRWTHPFVSARAPSGAVEAIVSHGETSERRRVELAPGLRVKVGEPLGGSVDAAVVRRIDLWRGGRADDAPAREVRTVWLVDRGPPTVRLAVIEGARSTTERVALDPRTVLTVGGSIRARGGPVTVVGLRARQRTWRRPGDAFPASEVRVVYGRRTVSPPAGSSPWRRERGTPSSRASSTSRSARSRSSPGRRRNRTSPRARSAAGGATESRSSPS